MRLENLPKTKEMKASKRVGRGPGSGMGKTSTRGHKGQWGKKRWRRTSQLRRRPNADDQKTSEDRFQQQEIRTRLQHSQHRRFQQI